MNRKGFTLLEVMVATLVMAIAIAGLLSALSATMRNAGRLNEYDRAVQLGHQKMDELLIATTKLPKNVPLDGAWDPTMGWRARVSTFEKPDGAGPGTPVLERVELEIWWINADKRRTFVLDGYRRGVLTPEEAGVAQ